MSVLFVLQIGEYYDTEAIREFVADAARRFAEPLRADDYVFFANEEG